MDGFLKRLNASIQRKLSFVLSAAILVVAVVAGLFSFLSALDEAHELQDDVLRQVAQLADGRVLSSVVHLQDGNEESRVIVQSLDSGSKSSRGVDEGGPLDLPPTLSDGLQTLSVGNEAFRVLVRTTPAGERIVVAQEAAFRDEIAYDGALRTVMPLLVLVPVLLWIVADLVRKMLRPVVALSLEIDQRSEQALHAIEDDRVPGEIRPFIVAINRLFSRVSRSMETQRRFIADAAHELRSPLTALSLQVERLADAEMSEQAHERVAVLRQGIERGRKMLDQLLGLARAQSSIALPASPLSVQAIYRRVLEDLMPLARAKRIDIGVEGAQDAKVLSSELDMIALVRNLVDNAIRYTPEDGRVDLSVCVSEGCALLRVQDTGPGIPEAERERVFDSFYRSLGSEQIGSGLGLAIVKATANRIGATIRLGFSDEARQAGLSVEIRMPLAGIPPTT
ncbi:ATP-binding protein [Bordetella sp. FB-8]|uniref:ATP-binding protein n=1 Tax=Bordetella sp. FB-8 TaxID=1159870 RepID=UPI0003607EEF|nr:ATP-binding protein [Bordetella sp. FB-8]